MSRGTTIGLAVGVGLLALVLVGGIIVGREASRSGQSLGGFLRGGGDALAPVTTTSGPPDQFDFMAPDAVGDDAFFSEKPLMAHVRVVDLDQDGHQDILTADVLAARITWLRNDGTGAFEERAISDSLGAPVHVEAYDIDHDGDLDVLVSAMGIMLPNNGRLGSVVVLENDGQERFTTRVLATNVTRVCDLQAGDLDGDGDVDLVAGQFGYDQGEINWLENQGDGTYVWHQLLNLAGTIHSPIVDIDGDGDLDVVALVSQEWEEVYVFENDGTGSFTTHIVFGAATDDFCSSGIDLGDLDGDGDEDILFTNGDAFVATDYRPLPNHGVQWLENNGDLTFTYHRITDYYGAYGPVVIDLDGDGDLDGVVGSCFNYWDRPETRSLLWLENDGTGTFTPRALAREPTHIVTVDAGDLDGDGRPEIVTGGMALYPPFERIQRLTVWRRPDLTP
jgi:hypothetical protein